MGKGRSREIAERRAAWTPGRCRWCLGPVPPPKRTFCGPGCVHEWKLRTDQSYVRKLVFRRDGGVCAQCGRDCLVTARDLSCLGERSAVEFLREVERLGLRKRVVQWTTWSALATLEAKGFSDPGRDRLRVQLAGSGQWAFRTLWEADHVVAIEEGGSFQVDNVATACWECHAKKTREHAARRAERRRSGR